MDLQGSPVELLAAAGAIVFAQIAGLAFLIGRQRDALPVWRWWGWALALEAVRLGAIITTSIVAPQAKPLIDAEGHSALALLVLAGTYSFLGERSSLRALAAGAATAAALTGSFAIFGSGDPLFMGFTAIAAVAFAGSTWNLVRGYRVDPWPGYLFALLPLGGMTLNLLTHLSGGAHHVSYGTAGTHNALMVALDECLILLSMLSLIFMTQRRQHQRALDGQDRLERSEQRFRDIADISGDWIWEMDADLRFTFVSERLEIVSGMTRSFYLGKARTELWSGDPADPRWQQHLDDLQARRAFRDFEYPFRTAGGRVRRARISGKPVYDKKGEFAGYRGTGTDVTSEVEARRQAAHLDRFLNDAFECMSTGVALYDTDDRLILANSALHGIFPAIGEALVPGRRFEDIVRLSAKAGLYPAQGADLETFVQDRLARHRNPPDRSTVMATSDGRWLQLYETKMDSGATVTSWTNVTSLKRREQALAVLVDSDMEARSFLDVAAEALAAGLGCRWAGVVRLKGEGRAEVLALWDTDGPGQTFEYDLAGTPCGNLDKKDEYCIYLDHVTDLFPQDEILSEMGAVSYQGHVVYDEEGHRLGHVFAIDDQPKSDDPQNREIAGLIARWVGFALRRHHAVAALEESEGHIRAIMDNVADSLITLDQNGRIESVNPVTERIFGYDADEMIGQDISTLIIGPERSGRGNFIQSYVEPSEARTHGDGREVTGRRKDGSTVDIELMITEMRRGGRRLFIGVMREITERKQREEALRQRTAFLELSNIVTAAANEATTTEQALEISVEQVCRTTGWSVGHVYLLAEDGSELVPTDIWYLDDPARYQDLKTLTMVTRYAPGMGLPGRVLTNRAPGGIPDVAQHTAYPFVRPLEELSVGAAFGFPITVGPEVVGVLEFFSDRPCEPDRTTFDVMTHVGSQLGRVIERARAARQLVAAKLDAETASRAKSQFLATMSHELRTPLNAIIGFSQIMCDELFGPLGHENYKGYAADIQTSGNHLLRIISDILDVSKVETGSISLHDEVIDLREVVTTSLRLITPAAEEKNILLAVDLPSQSVQIRGDPRRLKQVMINLLSNAVKFTLEGRVEVILATDGGEGVTLQVIDSGIGIDREDLERIFDPFVQTESAYARNFDGTGLGLSISRSLIELHGGELTIESKFGVGTVATVRLPAARMTDGASAA